MKRSREGLVVESVSDDKRLFLIRKRFYKELFPFARRVIDYLVTCNGVFPFSSCEIAPRFLINGNDLMNRATVFHDFTELHQYAIKSVPATLQIGGIFPTTESIQEGRHLCSSSVGAVAYGYYVLDVDIDDYQKLGLRSKICSCEQYECCNACWAVFMRPAREVLDYLLRTVFGFKHIFYVFSGRRGFHCWVVDHQVCTWTNDQRKIITQRLSAPRQNGFGADIPLQNAIVNILLPHFIRHFETTLVCKPPPEAIVSQYRLSQWRAEMCVRLLYPILDVSVSEDASHLIKLPLMPHQTTGYIATPLPPLENTHRIFQPEQDCVPYADMTPDAMELFVSQILLSLESPSTKKI